MSILGSSLTLPGIAGIALTIGMAVDANADIRAHGRRDSQRCAANRHWVGFDRAFIVS